MEKNIQEAINAVMQEVGYVQKERSQKLSYTFAGEAALIQAIRPSMVAHGIIMYVKEVLDVTRERYSTKQGTEMINTLMRGVVRFEHVSGTFVDVQAAGEGSDAGDKSANKSMTGMYKYAMRQTFCIETGDDPDKYSSEEQERAGKSETRTFSFEQLDAAHNLNKDAGYNDIQEILRYSILPEDAESEIVGRWFKAYLSSSANAPLGKASDANKAYSAYLKKEKK